MVTAAQVSGHRRELAALRGLAEKDLRLLFREFDTVAAARAALRDVLPRLVAIYGSAAATLGADWYDEVRDAAGARGRFEAIPAELPDRGRTDSLAGWAGETATSTDTMLVLVAGGVSRIIADADRGSITRSSIQDPASVGWKRIGTGACEFCRMLIARDQLYSEATADFASHDHCNCQAYPLIKGAEPIDVKDYVQSARNSQKPGESDEAYERRRVADRTRVREWLAENA